MMANNRGLDRLFRWWLFRRGFGVWLTVRLLAGLMLLLYPDAARTRDRFLGNRALALPIVLLVTMLSTHDTNRRGETELYYNLGTSPVKLAALMAIPGILAETIIQMLR